MHCLDWTLPTPAENLAADEALALAAEAGGPESLRFWEARSTFVVAGYANHLATEVNLSACQADGIPVFRRVSGGGTVLQMPGVLNYNLALSLDRAELATVTEANRFIMERNSAALSALMGQKISVRGHTDLAVGDRKCSGNAQRRFRRTVLFHGAILLAADLARIARYLNFPSKQPDYRQGRGHLDFVTNLNLIPAAVKAALRQAWDVAPAGTLPKREDHLVGVSRSVPQGANIALAEAINRLATGKYSDTAWNERF